MNRIEAIDQEWYTTIAERFVQQHKEVESGQMKAMDLLDRYTETYPTDQLKRFNEVIDEVQTEDRALIQKTSESDESLARWTNVIDCLGFLLALGLGVFVAFRAANAITKPLEKIIDVAREIGDKGDLDQEVDVRAPMRSAPSRRPCTTWSSTSARCRRSPRPSPAAISPSRSRPAPPTTR